MSAPRPPLPADDLAHTLAHTRALWEGVRGARIFITGGTGFFGTWLLESFAHANDTLGLAMHATVLTRDPAAFARRSPHLATRADLAYHAGDLGTFTYPTGRFTQVINAAADTGVWTRGESAAGLAERNVAGMQHVLEFTARAGAGNFLEVSSGAIYGPQPVGVARVPEDHPCAASPLPGGAAWGEGKRVAERLALSHGRQHGYAVKIARCFAFVGPHLEGSYAIASFIDDALRGRPVQVTGDGTPYRSYLYAADLAIWLWTLLFAAPAGGVYNVGSPDGVSLADVARAVAKEAGGLPVKILGTPEPGRPAARYVPATDRAETDLRLRAWVPLEIAIRKTMAWRQAGFLSPS